MHKLVLQWIPAWTKEEIGSRSRYYMLVGTVTPPIISFLYCIYLLFMPCLPVSLGYAILPQCHNLNWPLANFLIKTLILIETCITTLFMFTYESLLLCTLSGLTNICLISYIQLFQLKLGKLGNLRKRCRKHVTLRLLKMYKEIEVLVGIYNFIHQGLLTCSEKLLLVSCGVISLYIFVTSYAVIGIPLLLIVFSVMYETVETFYESDGKLKAKLFQVSHAAKGEMKRQDTFGIPYFRKRLRACRTLRLYLIQNIYYNATTPLELMNFCVSLTIDLLLL